MRSTITHWTGLGLMTVLQPVLAGLGPADLHQIDDLASRVAEHTRELHDEFHEHFEGQKWDRLIDGDIERLEGLAEHLHDVAHDSNGSDADAREILHDSIDFLRSLHRVDRLISRAAPYARGLNAREGLYHMRQNIDQLNGISLRLISFFPIDRSIVENEAGVILNSVKTLHDEFHEHLERYEISAHLDSDLEELEGLAEHLREHAYEASSSGRDARLLQQDIRDLARLTGHIDELLNRQARIGVRTVDWDGVEHMRQAMADVEASYILMNQMLGRNSHRDDHVSFYPDNREDRRREDFRRRHDDRYRDRHDRYEDHGHHHFDY